jgi:hypothetical protein
MQRTLESMTQVFTGLYPPEHTRTIPNFCLRVVNLENLFPNDDFCAYLLSSFLTNKSRLKKLSEHYSVKAATEWDPKLKISSAAVKMWIPDGITVNGRPKALGILDTINSSM